MSTIEESIDVDVPVHVAYNQWTQFKTFPRFMDGVRRVDHFQASFTHWAVRFGGRTYRFDAEIVEQVPDQHLSWEALDRPRHRGTVSFRSLDAERCRVTLRIDLPSKGLLERAGSALGIARRHVGRSLKCFKEFIEGQGRETGTWRGEITKGRVRPGSGQKRPEVPTWPTG
ncbi:SRPBCC family protein [Streptomyces minutiscleroticus]|uniref:Cyclase n=1 Tax=Streptomyces minutiscleroticus TaxID=68238 RepID=A0A918U8Q4_9ACTN|nr:SRPBCC family protein [Streptomyces minutiscleroticus]GGY11095.1 cyclase [Streptomyces minutiscleroticus]